MSPWWPCSNARHFVNLSASLQHCCCFLWCHILCKVLHADITFIMELSRSVWFSKPETNASSSTQAFSLDKRVSLEKGSPVLNCWIQHASWILYVEYTLSDTRSLYCCLGAWVRSWSLIMVSLAQLYLISYTKSCYTAKIRVLHILLCLQTPFEGF